MKSLALCKVTIPFRWTDLQPIKFAIDIIFLDDQPYAVTDWSQTAAGMMPTFVLNSTSSTCGATWPDRGNSVMDDPRLRV